MRERSIAFFFRTVGTNDFPILAEDETHFIRGESVKHYTTFLDKTMAHQKHPHRGLNKNHFINQKIDLDLF